MPENEEDLLLRLDENGVLQPYEETPRLFFEFDSEDELKKFMDKFRAAGLEEEGLKGYMTGVSNEFIEMLNAELESRMEEKVDGNV